MASNFQAHKYQLTLAGISSFDVPAPDEYAGFYSNPTSGTDGFFTHWTDPSIWTMVQKLSSSTSTVAKLGPIIQEAFMKQQSSINVLNAPFRAAHASNVCGTDVNLMGVDQLQDTWIAKSKSSLLRE